MSWSEEGEGELRGAASEGRVVAAGSRRAGVEQMWIQVGRGFGDGTLGGSH